MLSKERKAWILLTDTQASINPLSTQGKAFSGEINMLNNATLVKTWQEYDASGISLIGYSKVPHIFLYKDFSTKLITDCMGEFFNAP